MRGSFPYHKSKCAGSLTSMAIRGRPTVRRPVLILLRKLIPVSAAITIILRPCGRNRDPKSGGRRTAGSPRNSPDGSEGARLRIRSTDGCMPIDTERSSSIATSVCDMLRQFYRGTRSSRYNRITRSRDLPRIGPPKIAGPSNSRIG